MNLLINPCEAYALVGSIETAMNKQALTDILARHRAAFAQAGGTVTQCKAGEHSPAYDTLVQKSIDTRLYGCACGCKGDYTEHSMRLGESGIH